MSEKATLSSSVNFDSELEETQQEPESQQQETKGEGSKQEQSKSDEEVRTQESTADEYDISDSAIVLFEDEDNIFTSEGTIPKSSIEKKDNSDSNDNPEPEEIKDKIFGKFESVDDLKKSYKELEKKLGSQGEAVKQLKDLEPVLPLMEAMLNDPNFLDVADDYFSNPETQKEAIRKSLGLDEDYEFNLENALSDPKSPDAKVLEKLTSRQQQPAKKQTKPKTEEPKISEEKKKGFMEKYDLKEESYNEMLEKAKDYEITLDDIYFLMNKDKILSDREEKAQAEIKKQMKKAKEVGRSAANSGGSPEKSPEDSFMDAIGSSGGGLFD